VPDFTRSRMTASGLVLGRQPAAGSELPKAFGGLTSIVPTSDREFTTGDALVVYLRVFQNATAPVAARIRTEIIDGQDKTAFESTREIPAAAFADAQGVPVELPLVLTSLSRGPHILSATIEATGSAAVRRELLFRVR
jgi:hypothetical protein